MTTLEFLQSYWWLIIAVLGGLLVFLLFVQGGQTMLYGRASEAERQLMVNALGRKWELTFTWCSGVRFSHHSRYFILPVLAGPIGCG